MELIRKITTLDMGSLLEATSENLADADLSVDASSFSKDSESVINMTEWTQQNEETSEVLVQDLAQLSLQSLDTSEPSMDRPFVIPALLDNLEISALLDSGMASCFIQAAVIHKAQLEHTIFACTLVHVQSAFGQSILIKDVIMAPLTISKWMVRIPCYVINEISHLLILRQPFLKKYHYLLDFENNTFANIPAMHQGPAAIMILDNAEIYWDVDEFRCDNRKEMLYAFEISMDLPVEIYA
ncbi:uncharacterized protein V1518DRAFT_138378 [Limtongia smithiae]|uniref:uncharacterized protein n=1 Tax=Limtongia smithiae TaxID=1125753 RepID=UPI0034CF17E8